MPRVRAAVPAEICRVVSQATGAILGASERVWSSKVRLYDGATHTLTF